MSTNPLQNALAAFVYVVLVASFMFYGPQSVGPVESVLLPIGMLSLFVLSAAVMGYLFLYQPALLLLDGRRNEATDLFLKTVGIFAALTILALAAVLLYA